MNLTPFRTPFRHPVPPDTGQVKLTRFSVTAIANRFQTASHSISNGFALLEPSAGNASSG